jgi:hypothetical protein
MSILGLLRQALTSNPVGNSGGSHAATPKERPLATRTAYVRRTARAVPIGTVLQDVDPGRGHSRSYGVGNGSSSARLRMESEPNPYRRCRRLRSSGCVTTSTITMEYSSPGPHGRILAINPSSRDLPGQSLNAAAGRVAAAQR